MKKNKHTRFPELNASAACKLQLKSCAEIKRQHFLQRKIVPRSGTSKQLNRQPMENNVSSHRQPVQFMLRQQINECITVEEELQLTDNKDRHCVAAPISSTHFSLGMLADDNIWTHLETLMLSFKEDDTSSSPPPTTSAQT